MSSSASDSTEAYEKVKIPIPRIINVKGIIRIGLDFTKEMGKHVISKMKLTSMNPMVNNCRSFWVDFKKVVKHVLRKMSKHNHADK